MTEPTVCAICLTRDRPEFARKAVECFRAQTYEPKHLLIFNTGDDLEISHESNEMQVVAVPGMTIGGLRNHAMEYCRRQDIFIHFDDDDHSHPNRITEQVALLQASGADVVGYSDMLFWRDKRNDALKLKTPAGGWTKESLESLGLTWPPEQGWLDRLGEAWLYTSTKGGVPALGTSLCYKRSVWEKHHFANETQGVEDHWMREKHIAAVSCLSSPDGSFEPRMIARIHGGNTSNGYKLEEYVAAGSREWTRVPEWDQRVREIVG